jgi:DNA-binding IclR family transcriptional regulator
MIKSVKRAVNILDSFNRQAPELAVTELSKQLGLSKSTISRLLSTLREEGFVSKVFSNQKYRLGPKVLELADIFLSSTEWTDVARPHLKILRDKTDETVYVFVIDGDQRVCLEKFESSHELRPILNIGSRYPLHAGSAGKLLLAWLSQERRDEIFSKTGLPRLTRNTITNCRALEKELKKIRQTGYAIAHGERIPHVSSVAAPIRDFKGDVIAALCLHVVTNRFTPERERELARLSIEAADNISREIGFTRSR